MRKGILCVVIAAASFATAQVQRNIITPPSSVERPEDIGLRVHTNYFYYAPQPGDSPKTPPPGVTAETPGSIGCIYDLVSSPLSGCPVATATTLPTGGSETIVLVDAYDDPA